MRFPNWAAAISWFSVTFTPESFKVPWSARSVIFTMSRLSPSTSLKTPSKSEAANVSRSSSFTDRLKPVTVGASFTGVTTTCSVSSAHNAPDAPSPVSVTRIVTSPAPLKSASPTIVSACVVGSMLAVTPEKADWTVKLALAASVSTSL